MARALLLVALLASCACLGFAQKKPDQYNSITAAANPENYKGFSSWPHTIEEILKNSLCATDDAIHNLEFWDCNLWFIEELYDGKPSVSKVHCSEECAKQWGKVSRACYNQFRDYLIANETYSASAQTFFGECAVNIKFEAEQPKKASSLNLGSVKDEGTQTASLAVPAPVVTGTVVANNIPAEEVGAPTEMLSAESITDFAQSANLTGLMGLLDFAGSLIPADLLANFNGTAFLPSNAAIENFNAMLNAQNVTLTDEDVAFLLEYHLSPQHIMEAELKAGGEIETLLSEVGVPPLVSGTEGTDTFVKAAESTALVQLSIMAGDASVFVIDAVLEPPLGEEEAVEAAPGAPEGTTVPSAAAANVASAAAVAAGLLAAALLA